MREQKFFRRRLWFVAVAAIAASVLIATDGGRVGYASLRAAFRVVVSAPASWMQAWQVRRSERVELYAERDALREELVQLQAGLRDLAVCREETAALRALSGYVPGKQYRKIVAGVIAPLNFEGTQLLIDHGEEAGVVRGAAAVRGDGILLGRVMRVDAIFSEIALLKDPSTAIPARVLGTEVDGILRATVQGSLTLDLIPTDVVVPEGGMVVTVGIDQRIPPDLLVGRVRAVTRAEGSPFFHIDIEGVSPTGYPRFVSIVSVKE